MTGGGPILENYDPELGPPPDPPKKLPGIVSRLAVMAAIGSFLFGYDTGITHKLDELFVKHQVSEFSMEWNPNVELSSVVSGAMLVLKGYMDLKDLQEELVVSVTLGAAAIFSLCAGVCGEKFGKKPVIIISGTLFVIGGIILAACPRNAWLVLLIGRFVVGAAIGLSTTTVPPYIAEASPPNIRGKMVMIFVWMMTLGFLVAGVLNGTFSYLPNSYSWRIMLGVPAIPALLQTIGMFFMPESPRWLATHGKIEEAKATLLRVSGSEAVAAYELKSILKTMEQSQKERKLLGDQNILISMLKSPPVRRALVVGCSLQTFQQLCGINTVMYYSATIVRIGGATSTSFAIWMAAVVSAFNFACTFIGVFLVERAGRRILLLASTLGVIFTLIVLGLGFTLIEKDSAPVAFHEMPSGINITSSDMKQIQACFKYTTCDQCSYDEGCGFCFTKGQLKTSGSCVPVRTADSLASMYGRCTSNSTNSHGDPVFSPGANGTSVVWAQGYCPTKVSFIPILGMVLYLCCFSAGFAPMPWTLNAEIYPTWARSAGTAMATAANWTFNLLISLTFLTLANSITRQGAFFLYAGITAVALIWFYLVVPETKGKSMEQVQKLFENGWGQFRRSKKPEYANSTNIAIYNMDMKLSGEQIQASKTR